MFGSAPLLATLFLFLGRVGVCAHMVAPATQAPVQGPVTIVRAQPQALPTFVAPRAPPAVVTGQVQASPPAPLVSQVQASVPVAAVASQIQPLVPAAVVTPQVQVSAPALVTSQVQASVAPVVASQVQAAAPVSQVQAAVPAPVGTLLTRANWTAPKPVLITAAASAPVIPSVPAEPTSYLGRLFQGLSFALVVKALCMAGNVCVQVSPFPQVRRWADRKDTGEADAAPYVSIAFSGWQWCFYGTFAWALTQRSAFLILVHSNCLGAVLGSYYSFTFYVNCSNASSLNSFQRYLCAVLALVLLQVCAGMVLPAQRALILAGLVASFCSFVGACSLLVTVPAVIRTRDSRSIPFPLVCANFLSATVWCVCGWMLADPLVVGPNVVAAMSSMFCIVLKLHYDYEATKCGSGGIDDVLAMASGQQAFDKALAKETQLLNDVSRKQRLFNTFETSSLKLKEASLPPVDNFSDDMVCGTGGTC